MSKPPTDSPLTRQQDEAETTSADGRSVFTGWGSTWRLQTNELKFRSDGGDSPLLRICPMSNHHKTPTTASPSQIPPSSAVKTATEESQVSLLAGLCCCASSGSFLAHRLPLHVRSVCLCPARRGNYQGKYRPLLHPEQTAAMSALPVISAIRYREQKYTHRQTLRQYGKSGKLI